MLKTQLGPERFWASIHRYLTSHAYGSATTDDLRQAVLEATGQSLGWFWSQWMYSAGYPEFAVTRGVRLRGPRPHADRAADPGGHRHRRQHRSPLRHAARLPRADRDPGRHRRGRRRRAGSRSTGASRRCGSTACPARRRWWRSTTRTRWSRRSPSTSRPRGSRRCWTRHPHLWQRAWAIEQLALRTDDSLAGAALARAARGADYSLTRAEAATALRRFPAAVALPALDGRRARHLGPGARGGRVVAWPRSAAPRRRARGRMPGGPTRATRYGPPALLALARLGAPDARAAVLRGARDAVLSRRHSERRYHGRRPAARSRSWWRRWRARPVRSRCPTAGLAALAARGDSTRPAGGCWYAGRRAGLGAGLGAGGGGGAARPTGRGRAAARGPSRPSRASRRARP